MPGVFGQSKALFRIKRVFQGTNKLRKIRLVCREKDEVINVTQRLILASGSPRRADLMKQVGARIEVITSAVDEKMSPNIRVEEMVQKLALNKARAVAQGISSGLIIGADTVVVKGTGVLGKPADFREAVQMLTSLSGDEHRVLTGVAVVEKPDGNYITGYEETKVLFRKLSSEEIIAYVKTKECFDKAGGYGIQGRGALLVEKIDGDYFNVVGLPLQLLNRLLGKWKINLLMD